MKHGNLIYTITKYITVGLFSALIHAVALISLSNLLSLALSNLIGFLLASFTSYLGHALFTFRKETKGKRFARRWLTIQYTTNIMLSISIPIIIDGFIADSMVRIILIFIPTLVNGIIWINAKNFSEKRDCNVKVKSQIHADDFGLTESVNDAIYDLITNKKLHSASLIVNGCAVDSAVNLWKREQDFPIYLHLCLTEGPANDYKKATTNLISKNGLMNISFLKLLLASLLPKKNLYRKDLEVQLKSEIISQIKKFTALTGLRSISLDGHQHVHLIPLVLEIILDLKEEYSINWIRSTNESIPSGIPLSIWAKTIYNGGLTKWLILQTLSYLAKSKLKIYTIQTNSSFSGVLFTGRMTMSIVSSAIKEFQVILSKSNETHPIILSHPSYTLKEYEKDTLNSKFKLSSTFLRSKWRLREYNLLKNISI